MQELVIKVYKLYKYTFAIAFIMIKHVLHRIYIYIYRSINYIYLYHEDKNQCYFTAVLHFNLGLFNSIIRE